MRFSRRDLLKNTALATLVAPVLRRRDALAATSPRRVILLYNGNGPMKAAGPASGTETSFTFHDWWKPLERHKADGIFLSHMAATGSGVVVGGGHGLGGQTLNGYGVAPGGIYKSDGETIDQVIGKRLEAEGRAGLRRSVVWGLSKNDAFYAGPSRPIVPEVDPSKAWTDLFSRFTAPAPTEAGMRQVAARIEREKSMLDFVNQDCKALRDALGTEGMRLLDDHCTTLRSMEMNVQNTMAGPTAGSTCTKPANPGLLAWTNPENIDAQMAAFTTLMVTALACELTHVIGFQFSGMAARNRIASKYAVPSSPQADSGDSGPAHHPWTHQGDSALKMSALGIFTTFYSNQVALLIDKLKATNDVNGKPLLDSTLVVWLSELGGNAGNRDAHQTGQTPVVMFGRGQGTFKTGRYIRGKCLDSTYDAKVKNVDAGQDMAKLLVSVIQYMGLTSIDTVGVTGAKGRLDSLHT